MEGKKKYFALIIFLFLGLMIFTFANPAEEEKEFKGGDKDQSETVTNKREDTTEEDDDDEDEQEQQEANQQQNVTTNNNQGNAQGGNQGNNPGQTPVNPVDNTLRDALAAVEKAEGTYTQNDVNAAKDLVNNVTDTTEKGKLEERLEEVEAGIAVLALVEQLEEKVEDAEEKTDMTNAAAFRDTQEIANKINALNNETVKEELSKRLGDASKLLDDNAAPTTKVEAKVYGDNVEITAEDEAGNPFQIFLTKDEENEEEISSGHKTASDGVYTLRLVDNAFNEQTIKFTVDTTAPALKDLTNGAHYEEITLNTEDATKVTIKVTNQDKKETKEVEEGTKLTEDATYKVVLTDEAGNTSTYWLAIDTVKPNISTTHNSIINYNKWTEVTDKFLTNVTIKHVAVDGTETIKEFTRADFTVGANNENFKFRYKLDTEGVYTITGVDKAGNTKTEKVTMDKTPAKLVSANMYSTGDKYTETKDGKDYSVYYTTDGDTITAYIRVNEQLKTIPTITLSVGDKSYAATNVTEAFHKAEDEAEGIYRYQATVKVDEFNPTDGDVQITVTNIYDKAGNKTSDVTKVTNRNIVRIDRTEAKRVYSTIRSSAPEVVHENGNDRDYYHKNGTQFEYAISFDELLKEIPTVTIGGRNVEMKLNEKVLKNENKYIYEGTFKIAEDEAELTEGTLEIKVTNVKDLAGNVTTLTDQTKTSNGRRVIYDRTKPAGKVTSSNNNGGKPTNQDVVATLKTEEYVKTPEGWTVVVEGHEFTRVYTKNTKTSVKVIDNAGNENTIQFEIKRIDKVAPELTITDSEKYQLEVHSEYIDKGYSAYDKVDKDVTKLVKKAYEFQAKGENEYKSVEGIDTSKLGTYKVTYTAYDKAGNTTIGTREVEIVDTTAPTINLAGTAGKNNNELIIESGTEISLDDILAKVTDNYDEETTIKPYKADLLISNVASENKYNIKDFSNGLNTNYVGRYNVYYEHEDSNGNKSKATMLIVMKDTIKPEIILPGTAGKNKNELIVESGTEITYDDLIAQVEDVTAEKTVAPKKADLLISNVASENKYNIQDFSNGLSTAYVGRYNIQYTITDKGGNTTTKTMLLIMKDTVKPELSARITDGRTYITGKDVTDLQFNVYKNGELKHSYNSATSDAGKTFSLSTGWFGNGIYIIEAVDKGGNKTTLETYVTSNELTALNYIDTVKLTKDVELDERIIIAEGQTKEIDLNGHKLTVKNVDGEKKIQNNGKLTVKNGSIVNENKASTGVIENTATGELIIENVKFDDQGGQSEETIENNGGKVTITNSEFNLKTETASGSKRTPNAALYNNDGDLVIKNTKITGESDVAYGIGVANGNVLLEDLTITHTRGGISIYGGDVTLNNANITIKEGANGYYALYIPNVADSNVTINGGKYDGHRAAMYLQGVNGYNGKVNLTVNDGVFTHKHTKASYAALIVAKAQPTHQINLTINGGTFKKKDVTEYIDTNIYRQDMTDWTVKEKAKIDSISYLKEIATVGGTYTLDSDLTLENEIIKVAKNINLTINTNGKKISGTSDKASTAKLFEVASGGNLTLTGNGTITFRAYKPDTNWDPEGFPTYATNTIANSGTLVIDGPTIINTTPRGGASYAIDNYAGGNLTVLSGTIKQTGGDVAIRMNTATAGEAKANNVTIKGGTISGRRAIWIHLAGSSSSVAPYVNLTINGGTLDSTDDEYNLAIYSYSYGNDVSNVKVTFNGGTFNGLVGFGAGTKNGQETVIITGGTFNKGIGRYLADNGWENLQP